MCQHQRSRAPLVEGTCINKNQTYMRFTNISQTRSCHEHRRALPPEGSLAKSSPGVIYSTCHLCRTWFWSAHLKNIFLISRFGFKYPRNVRMDGLAMEYRLGIVEDVMEMTYDLFPGGTIVPAFRLQCFCNNYN